MTCVASAFTQLTIHIPTMVFAVDAQYIDHLVAYTVHRMQSPTTTTHIVRRRYNDFETLHETLTANHAACILPPLPSKKRLAYLDRFAEDFIERRQAALERYANRLVRHPIVRETACVRSFFTDDMWSGRSSAGGANGASGAQEGLAETIGDKVLNGSERL